MISLPFYIVFFLFSSTKIGHGRPSVKNRCAISDKNILRSYVVRYFYLKFLACHPSASWEMYKKKEKKCVPMQCVGNCCNNLSGQIRHQFSALYPLRVIQLPVLL